MSLVSKRAEDLSAPIHLHNTNFSPLPKKFHKQVYVLGKSLKINDPELQ